PTKRHVADERVLGQDRLKRARAGGTIKRSNRGRTDERRRHGVEAGEVRVEHRRGGARDGAGFGLHLGRALGTRLERGPRDRGADEGDEHGRRSHHLAENGLSSKNPQGFFRSYRRRSGSDTPASANPRARSTQLS